MPTRTAIRRALESTSAAGYRAVLTSALTDHEQSAFTDLGFRVHERLHLLGHRLDDIPTADPSIDLRRGRRRDIPAVLGVDGRSFDAFWRFDREGLDDARTATPHSRFRVAIVDGAVVGYHVTGRSGPLGYLQRLAVDPDHEGHGIGTALVADALHWCRRHRCRSVLVNTQEINERAYHLYLRLGFEPEPSGLAVLMRDSDTGR